MDFCVWVSKLGDSVGRKMIVAKIFFFFFFWWVGKYRMVALWLLVL